MERPDYSDTILRGTKVISENYLQWFKSRGKSNKIQINLFERKKNDLEDTSRRLKSDSVDSKEMVQKTCLKVYININHH